MFSHKKIWLYSNSNSQRGVSLLEIILCLAMGSICILLVYEILQHNKQNEKLRNQLNDRSQEILITLAALKTEMKLTKSLGGCVLWNKSFPMFIPTMLDFSFQQPVIIKNKILTVKHPSEAFSYLAAQMLNRDQLIITKNIQYKVDDLLVITDCEKSEVFVVLKVIEKQSHYIIIPRQPFHSSYLKGAEVARMEINKFMISERNNHSNLVLKSLHNNPRELLADIGSFSAKYIIRRNGKIIETNRRDANDQLVGIKIELSTLTKNSQTKWLQYVSLIN